MLMSHLTSHGLAPSPPPSHTHVLFVLSSCEQNNMLMSHFLFSWSPGLGFPLPTHVLSVSSSREQINMLMSHFLCSWSHETMRTSNVSLAYPLAHKMTRQRAHG